jgi:hypothetical protein
MGSFLLYVLFCLLDYLFILLDVFAFTTYAILVARFAVGEAFTVHF